MDKGDYFANSKKRWLERIESNSGIDFSELEPYGEQDSLFWRELFEFELWGMGCFMRDNRTMLRFRLQGGMGLTKGVLIDLICDGVTSSDVDWRISEVLRVWGETQKDAVTVNIQDNLTRYVSRITCSKAWIEIVMVSDDLLNKQTYTIAARCLKADLNKVEIENEQDSESEESDAIRIDDLVIVDHDEKFIDRYFGEGTS